MKDELKKIADQLEKLNKAIERAEQPQRIIGHSGGFSWTTGVGPSTKLDDLKQFIKTWKDFVDANKEKLTCEHAFKYGDPVLVRDDAMRTWVGDRYIGQDACGSHPYLGESGRWKCCIPFDIEKMGKL